MKTSRTKEAKAARRDHIERAHRKLITLGNLLKQMDEGTTFEPGFLWSYVDDAQTSLTQVQISLGEANLL